MNNKRVKPIIIYLLIVIVIITGVYLLSLQTTEPYADELSTADAGMISSTEDDNVSFEKDNTDIEKEILGEYFEYEITIPRNIKLGEEEVVEIILPPILLSPDETLSIDEQAQYEYDTLVKKGIYPEVTYGNEDGTVSIILDADNLELYIQLIEGNFNNNLSESVRVSEDLKKVMIYVNEQDLLTYAVQIQTMWGYMAYSQILSGTPCFEWSIEVTSIYEPTGEIMFEHKLNEQNRFHMTEEEWQKRLEEVQGQ